jgi:hypothetical protein
MHPGGFSSFGFGFVMGADLVAAFNLCLFPAEGFFARLACRLGKGNPATSRMRAEIARTTMEKMAE